MAFFYYGLVSVLSVPSRLIQDNSTMAFILLSLSIGLLITIIALPMLWLVCLLNQRFKLGEKSILYPLGLIALVGAIRGEIIYLVIAESNLEDNLHPALAILSSVVFTLIYFTIISSFMEMALQRKDKFNQIFTKASLLLANPGSTIDKDLDPKDVYNEILGGIKGGISATGLSREKFSAEALLEASKLIQSQINEVLRPLSHRLWVNGMGQVKHRNLAGILKDAIGNLDFNVWYFLAYQFFIGGYGISLVLGVEAALYVTSIGVTVSALLIKGYFAFQSRLGGKNFSLGMTFLILEGLLPVFVPIAIRNPLSESASAIGGLFVSPTLPGLILIVSAYRLIVRDREVAIGAATSVGFRVASLPEKDTAVEGGIHLAEYIHNSLQSELFSIAKRLEVASGQTENESTKDVLDSLELALNRDYQDIALQDLGGVRRIKKMISSWQGIAEIELSNLELLEEGSTLANRACQILEELITNTIRYGRADQIQIELALVDAKLEILIKHNGKGEISKRSGLGSLLLAQQSPAGVGVVAEQGKTYLRVGLPVSG
jgi:signal transduction histidine kinase